MQQNCPMNDKINPSGGATRTLELAAVMERLYKSLQLPSVLEKQFAALQGGQGRFEALAKQLAAYDSDRGTRSAIEKHGILGESFSEKAQAKIAFAISSEQGNAAWIKKFAELNVTAQSSAARLAAALAQHPSLAELMKESNSSRALMATTAAWNISDTKKTISRLFENLQGSIGGEPYQTLLESMAKFSEPGNAEKLLAESQRLDAEGTGEQVVSVAQGVAEGVSKALTRQEVVDQIVSAIVSTKEPLHQKMLWGIFFPFLMMLFFSGWNPYADFHMKKSLDGVSTQAANKQVKEAARESVGDLRLLRDYRFVTAQSLAVRAEPKARGQTLGQLRLGQTVHVLGKERDFTLVAWQSEDGNAELKGWVFSRYLKRFQ